MFWNIDENLGEVREVTLNCFALVSFGDILCICGLFTFGGGSAIICLTSCSRQILGHNVV